MFDYIICGAGCAGLSLLYRIMISPELINKRILIIDNNNKNKNDRTWCFWSKEKILFDEIVKYKWKKVYFNSEFFSKIFDLNEYTYQMISGIDLYKFVFNQLKNYPNITFLNAEVLNISDEKNFCKVYTDQGNFETKYVFNSIFSKPKITPNRNYLLQHFKGYEIETNKDIFDTEKITFMDFDISQEKECRFVYVLPFKKNRALVEFTIFSENLLVESEYDKGIDSYIKNNLKINDYKISETEFGVIPMTDIKFKQRESKNIINIGTNGGMTKTSTGYTFMRIQKHSDELVKALETNNLDIYYFKHSLRYGIYDRLILDIMKKNGHKISFIFSKLFQANPIDRMFKFLYEEATFIEDLKIMYSSPWKYFFKAIFDLYIRIK